jgi:hypothetical protein
LKTIKGNHYYLLFDHKSRNIPEELLQKEIKINWSWEDGKMVRIINDDIAYDIPFTYDEEGRAIPNVRIFKDSTGQEIIYTNNITFFLDNLHYNKILVSSNITDN